MELGPPLKVDTDTVNTNPALMKDVLRHTLKSSRPPRLVSQFSRSRPIVNILFKIIFPYAHTFPT